MTIPYSAGWAFAVPAALLLIVPAQSAETDLCHLIPVAHVAEVTGKAVAIERQSTGTGNCVYYVGEVRGDPPLPDYIVEFAHDDDSGALYAPMFFAGHEVANVGEGAYWAESGSLWFISQGNTYYIQLALLDGDDGDPKTIATTLALTAIDNLARTVEGESAAAAATEAHPIIPEVECPAPPEWPDRLAQIGAWRVQRSCIAGIDSLDIGTSELTNPAASITLACWDGQMSGSFWFNGEPAPPEGGVKVVANANPSPIETSGELFDLFGVKGLEVEDDAFVRALAQTMAEAGGGIYSLRLASDGGAVTDMTFALDGFGEAARPLRTACGW